MSAALEVHPAYVFDYVVSGARDARPVLAFDDGRRTFLHFDDLRHLHPVIRSESGAVLRWDRLGPYAVVHGRFARLQVQLGWATADVVKRTRPAVVVRRTRPAAVAVAQPPWLERPFSVRHNPLASRADDAAPHAADARPPVAIDPASPNAREARRARLAEGRFVARFGDGHGALEVDGRSLEALATLARHVRALADHGPNAGADTTPAEWRRAIAVRQLLHARGIDARAMRVRYFHVKRRDDATTHDAAPAPPLRRVAVELPPARTL